MKINIFQKKIIKIDIITAIILILMLLSLVWLIFYFYTQQINSCTSNPLVYGAKQYEDQFQIKVTGQLIFLTQNNAPIIVFNSTDLYSIK